jgi:hypothetical protein
MFYLKGGKGQSPAGPSYFKDEHDGVSPIETFHGTKYLLKWPDYRKLGRYLNGKLEVGKWVEDVEPWLAEKGIKIHYHDSRKALMFDSKSDALMFKLTWDKSDFTR